MENYNEEEKGAVIELKSKLKCEMEENLYEDENLFYRFLKARDFNINNAEKLLREHLKWRNKFDVKNFSKYKHPEVILKYLPVITLGYDKEGYVIHYMEPGSIDWIGLNASCKLEDLIRRMIDVTEHDMENMKQKGQKLGKTLDKILYIMNMENLSFTQATDKKVAFNFIHLLNVFQNDYPETLKAVYVINASIYFSLLFSLLKTFVPAAILQKLLIYSDDSWKADLLKVIDAEILPECLGGTRNLDINLAKPVPEQYFIHRSKRSLANEPGIKKITLSRASFHEVVLEVKEQDSYLEWEFEIECKDIGFGLFYQDDEENKIELLPIQRINTDQYSESGIYKCDNAGTYIVVFDNTYSLIRSKAICYKIKIISPKEAAAHLAH